MVMLSWEGEDGVICLSTVPEHVLYAEANCCTKIPAVINENSCVDSNLYSVKYVDQSTSMLKRWKTVHTNRQRPKEKHWVQTLLLLKSFQQPYFSTFICIHWILQSSVKTNKIQAGYI